MQATNIANRFGCVVVIGSALLVSACQEEPELVTERVRAIKPFYVSEIAGGDVRTFSGVVAAGESAALSFGVAGTVATVNVSAGDVVLAGDVLATMDPQTFQLDLDAANAELQRASADASQKVSELGRQRELFTRGWVTRAALDQAIAAAEAADGALAVAQSRLGSAERDLARTSLIAPFDGVVAERVVEPFTEISGSQTVFTLNSEAVIEVELSIPSAIVGRMSVGLPILIDAATVPDCGCDGRITEIAATSGTANAVPVTALLADPPPGLLPGTSADVTIMLSETEGPRGFLVPLDAIAAGDGDGQGYVFRFDPDSGTVQRISVVGQAGRDNLVAVTGGVEAGDILAAAGVSFLRDGQQVRLPGE